MYGYMRVDAGRPDREVVWDERALRVYAEAEGYRLAGIRYAEDDGRLAELSLLVGEIARDGGGPVVVPSGAHLGRGAALRACVRAWVAAVTGNEPREVRA